MQENQLGGCTRVLFVCKAHKKDDLVKFRNPEFDFWVCRCCFCETGYALASPLHRVQEDRQNTFITIIYNLCSVSCVETTKLCLK